MTDNQNPARQKNLAGEDDIVEAMIESLRDPFPLTMLSVSGGIDRWREIMRTAYRAAIAANPSPSPRERGE